MRREAASQEVIASFLSARSFAVIGVSADRKKTGNALYRAMRERAFSVVPVHRTLESVEGAKCYHSVAELQGIVVALVSAVPPKETEQLLALCAGRGFTHIWMQMGSGSERAVALAHELGMKVINGECLLMFLEPVRSVHAFHRWLTRLVGKYPSPARA